MNKYSTYEDVIKEAKKSFKDVERNQYEKQKNKKPYFKEIGFVDGMKKVLVYR